MNTGDAPTEAEGQGEDAAHHGGVVGYVLDLVRRRGARYVLVSVVNVVVGSTLLFFLQAHMTPSQANILAVCIGAVPAYYLNRIWVWGKRGRSHLRREVLPFWGFVVAGLILSTLFISYVENHTENRIAIMFTQLSAFGVLWVLRFFLFDKIFHLEADAPDDEDDDLGPAADLGTASGGPAGLV